MKDPGGLGGQRKRTRIRNRQRLGRCGVDAGPRGRCVCLACGIKVLHARGVPCSAMVCPECGGRMGREV